MDFLVIQLMSLLSTYTKKELIKKAKKQKFFILIQGFVILLMVALAIFSTIEEGISFLTFLPFFFIPMEFVMIFELKKINKELASRN